MPSTESALRGVTVALYGLFLLGLMLAVPFAFGALLERVGVRALAGLGLVASLVSIPVARSFPGFGRSRALSLALPLLLVLAGALGNVTLLRLTPALVHLCVGLYLLESLAGEALMVRAVRWLSPEAPDFVEPYCRKLTGVWGAFFLTSAGTSAGFALWGSADDWRLVSGPGVCGLMAVMTGVEFFVRKTWFRYYFHGGPFDRLWARLFPAEATPQGRRSLEAIARYRDTHSRPQL